MVTLYRNEDNQLPVLSTKLEKLSVDKFLEEDANLTVDCTTPNSKEHRIPDVLTCPPAPRKRKASYSCIKLKISNKKFKKVAKFVENSEVEAKLGLHQVSGNKIPRRSKKFL